MKSEIVIAHLSDLHHPSIREDRWRRLTNYLVERQPDLILVTGDLTNHPCPRRHSQVKRKLQCLRQECEDAAKKDIRLLVIPGNHDAAFWGSFGVSFFRMLSFDLVFKAFQEKYFEVSVGKNKVCFFFFNSNPFVAGWAKGKGSQRQLKWFQTKIDELQKKDPERFDETYKVAVLHHHPMPMPHDEKLEKYLFLKNPGEFINSMAQNRVNLILHGHKHKSRISFISLDTASTARNIAIVASGSTLKDMNEDNACNLITIFENMRAQVKQVFAKPDDDFEEEAATNLPAWESYIQERYEAIRSKLGYEIEILSHTVVVDAEGDGHSLMSVKGLRIASPKRFTSVAPFEHTVGVGTIQNFRLRGEGAARNLIRVDQRAERLTVNIDLLGNATDDLAFEFDYWTLFASIEKQE